MDTKLEDIKKIGDWKERESVFLGYCNVLLLKYRAEEIRHAHEEIVQLLGERTKAGTDFELETVAKYHKGFAAQALRDHAFGQDIRRFTFWAFLSFLEAALMPHYDESNGVKHLLWALVEQGENHANWKAIRAAIADGVDEDLTYNHEAHEFARMQAQAGWHHIPEVFRCQN
jgi:hypothetical protein